MWYRIWIYSGFEIAGKEETHEPFAIVRRFGSTDQYRYAGDPKGVRD